MYSDLASPWEITHGFSENDNAAAGGHGSGVRDPTPGEGRRESGVVLLLHLEPDAGAEAPAEAVVEIGIVLPVIIAAAA